MPSSQPNSQCYNVRRAQVILRTGRNVLRAARKEPGTLSGGLTAGALANIVQLQQDLDTIRPANPPHKRKAGGRRTKSKCNVLVERQRLLEHTYDLMARTT